MTVDFLVVDDSNEYEQNGNLKGECSRESSNGENIVEACIDTSQEYNLLQVPIFNPNVVIHELIIHLISDGHHQIDDNNLPGPTNVLNNTVVDNTENGLNWFPWGGRNVCYSH